MRITQCAPCVCVCPWWLSVQEVSCCYTDGSRINCHHGSHPHITSAAIKNKLKDTSCPPRPPSFIYANRHTLLLPGQQLGLRNTNKLSKKSSMWKLQASSCITFDHLTVYTTANIHTLFTFCHHDNTGKKQPLPGKSSERARRSWPWLNCVWNAAVGYLQLSRKCSETSKKKRKERRKKRRKKKNTSWSGGCSTSAGNELIKGEKEGNPQGWVVWGGETQEGWGRKME